MSAELHFLTVTEASRLIGRRALSPVELTEAYLRRIEEVDGKVHSYVTVTAERALERARSAEREIMAGRRRGALHGIPYALKDTFYTQGIRTTAGSRLMMIHVPSTSATAYARLEAGGATLLGKLSTYEYGTGTGADLHELPFPPARNPWNTNCFTGGSSTGSGAAVAAGTTMVALGADTGGSIRLPAAGCGVVGLKPTYGLVSRARVLPNCYSLDHIGPLTWTVGDAALVLQVIAGYDARDPASARRPPEGYDVAVGSSLQGVRIGVLRRFHEDLGAVPEIAAAFAAAAEVLRGLGAELFELALPVTQQNFLDCLRVINMAECFSIHERDFRSGRARMGRALRDKLFGGACLQAADYLRAQRWRRQLAAQLNALFGSCDVIMCCGTARAAPAFEDSEAVAAFTTDSAMAPFSLSGHPALSICNGFARALPLNMQLAAPYFGELQLLRVAAAYEQATPWRARRPACEASAVDSGAARAPGGTDAAPPETADRITALAKQLDLPDISAADYVTWAAAYRRVAMMLARLPADLPKETEPATVIRLD